MNLLNKLKSTLSDAATITIPTDRLQSEISKAFPMTWQKLGGKATVGKPVVSIDAQRPVVQVVLDLSAQVPLLGTHQGQVTAEATPRFDAATRKVFVEDVRVLRLSLPGVPDQLVGSLRALVEVGLAQQAQSWPVYELPDTFKANRVKDMVVENGAIVVRLGL